MRYDFDSVIDRRQTGSLKWDCLDEFYGEKDLLPMWVADMDFESPRPVVEALVRRAQHGIYGYCRCMPAYFEATMEWIKRRHGWDINREWILFCPGLVPAVSMLVRTFARPGDKVIIQLPAYYPFMRAVENNGLHVLNSPLRLEDGKYRMDFVDLGQKAKDKRARILILCSPHNPVGRVWTTEELIRLGEICIEHGLLVIADEVHSDLILNGCKHTPFGSLSVDFLNQSITLSAPSKTFNLAGLHTSNVIIADLQKRREFEIQLLSNGISGPSAFGAVALEAAYRYGEEWLDQLLDYLAGNLQFLKEFIRERIPDVKVIEPEATYLVWLDFRELGLDKNALEKLMQKQAKVALDEGYIFGEAEGAGFERINIACPRTTLQEGLERIERAVRSVTGL
jgi:cystathionine beta-lyase